MNINRTTHTSFRKYMTLSCGDFFYYNGQLFLKINENKTYNFSTDAFNYCFCDDTRVAKVDKDNISITFSV